MPNCTCYAFGRYHEICGVWLPTRGNAENWAVEAGKKNYKIYPTPTLGSVAVFRKGKVQNAKDGCGHVAIVEAILPNGDIITSNSGWFRNKDGTIPKNSPKYPKMFWYEKKHKASKNYEWGGYHLVGFIRPTSLLTEAKADYTVKAKDTLHISPTSVSLALTEIRPNDIFRYDGIYQVAEGQKWVHGTLLKSNVMGWTSAKSIS